WAARHPCSAAEGLMARSVKYTPDYRGRRDFGREQFIGALSVDAGRAVAEWAKPDDPGGGYDVREVGVAAGRHTDRRAGAGGTEPVRDRGHVKRSLARAAQEARGHYDPN